MKTLAWIFVLAFALPAAGCNRASEEKCREAVRNILALTELDKSDNTGPDEHAAIRSCRANASKDAVDCMIKAKTLADLEQCEGGLASQLANDAPAKAPEGDSEGE